MMDYDIGSNNAVLSSAALNRQSQSLRSNSSIAAIFNVDRVIWELHLEIHCQTRRNTTFVNVISQQNQIVIIELLQRDPKMSLYFVRFHKHALSLFVYPCEEAKPFKG